jgi:hypothetical protein
MDSEPARPVPPPVRYSARAFPPYRFVPGRSPHPRRHPQGHAYGTPEVPPPRYEPERWRENEEYLYGIDLFNHRYWWECHESLEGLWHLTGHAGREALYLQGVIQVAAANLQRFLGHADGARRLAVEAIEKLVRVEAKEFMGLKLGPFIRQVNDYHLDEDVDAPPVIILDG